ncbi:unnamed protein product [Cochlearia groenlandica]
MLKQILDNQGRHAMEVNKKLFELNAKVDGAYVKLNAKYDCLASHVKSLDNQVAQVASSSKGPTGKPSG